APLSLPTFVSSLLKIMRASLNIGCLHLLCCEFEKHFFERRKPVLLPEFVNASLGLQFAVQQNAYLVAETLGFGHYVGRQNYSLSHALVVAEEVDNCFRGEHIEAACRLVKKDNRRV